MAITVDNSIARVSSDGGASAAVGPFNAVSGQLILATGQLDQNSQPYVAATISNDGAALTWTNIVNNGAADSATVACWYTHLTGDRSNLTVTLTRGNTDSDSPSLKIYLLSGHDSSTILGASTASTSTTNNLTTASITPQTSGTGFGVGADYNELGLPSSSDLTNTSTFDTSGDIAGISGYKALTSGVGATCNLDAFGGSAAAWRYAWFEIRVAAGAGRTTKNIHPWTHGVNNGIGLGLPGGGIGS